LELFEDHTAYVERTHLTMRQMNGRLIRTCRSKGPRLLIAPRLSALASPLQRRGKCTGDANPRPAQSEKISSPGNPQVNATRSDKPSAPVEPPAGASFRRLCLTLPLSATPE
jgi:hypothetical protein